MNRYVQPFIWRNHARVTRGRRLKGETRSHGGNFQDLKIHQTVVIQSQRLLNTNFQLRGIKHHLTVKRIKGRRGQAIAGIKQAQVNDLQIRCWLQEPGIERFKTDRVDVDVTRGRVINRKLERLILTHRHTLEKVNPITATIKERRFDVFRPNRLVNLKRLDATRTLNCTTTTSGSRHFEQSVRSRGTCIPMPSGSDAVDSRIKIIPAPSDLPAAST